MTDENKDKIDDKIDETAAYRKRVESAIAKYSRYHQWMTLAIFILASFVLLDILISFHNRQTLDAVNELLVLDLGRLHDSDRVVQSRITVLEQQGKAMQREHQEILGKVKSDR